MGINPPLVYAALKLYAPVGHFAFEGKAFDSLAWAIAWGFCDWLDNPINVTLMGLSTGTVGTGYIPDETTRLFVIPATPLMVAALETAGINGPLKSSLATTVTLAITHVVTQFGGYMGVSAAVGVGTDVSKVINANGLALIETLLSSMAEEDMKGPAAQRMANGLGMGIAALVLTAFGTGKVVGAVGPAPSSGPSLSKVS